MSDFIGGWPWLEMPEVPRVVVVQIAREVLPVLLVRDIAPSPTTAADLAFQYAEAFVKKAQRA
jgi:hypothetical protein